MRADQRRLVSRAANPGGAGLWAMSLTWIRKTDTRKCYPRGAPQSAGPKPEACPAALSQHHAPLLFCHSLIRVAAFVIRVGLAPPLFASQEMPPPQVGARNSRD